MGYPVMITERRCVSFHLAIVSYMLNEKFHMYARLCIIFYLFYMPVCLSLHLALRLQQSLLNQPIQNYVVIKCIFQQKQESKLCTGHVNSRLEVVMRS